MIEQTTCAECGGSITKSDRLKGPDGWYYCDDCFHSCFMPCEECGEAIKPGTGVTYVNEGYALCDDCIGYQR